MTGILSECNAITTPSELYLNSGVINPVCFSINDIKYFNNGSNRDGSVYAIHRYKLYGCAGYGNSISGIVNSNTGIQCTRYKYYYGTSSSAATISNNLITDIFCYSVQYFIYISADQIAIDSGTTGGVNVYFNSINLLVHIQG
jgi:hypothetical protein